MVMSTTRVVIMGLMATLGAALLVGSFPGTAAASCVGPQLFVSPEVTAPGTLVTVSGFAFTPDCNDSGPPGQGPGDPYENVEFVVRVGESEKAVGRLDVSPDLDFVTQVHIPPSLGTGAAEILATTGGSSPEVLDRVPLEVVGAPRDTGDFPYIDFTQERASFGGIPWSWVGLGVAIGASVTLLVGWLARRRSSRSGPLGAVGDRVSTDREGQ
jgi:hypothetical protein